MFQFRLDGASGVPPYLQIVHQVRQSLLLGYLRPGDTLVVAAAVPGDLTSGGLSAIRVAREESGYQP